jgi:hypothetical protein
MFTRMKNAVVTKLVSGLYKMMNVGLRLLGASPPRK